MSCRARRYFRRLLSLFVSTLDQRGQDESELYIICNNLEHKNNYFHTKVISCLFIDRRNHFTHIPCQSILSQNTCRDLYTFFLLLISWKTK